MAARNRSFHTVGTDTQAMALIAPVPPALSQPPPVPPPSVRAAKAEPALRHRGPSNGRTLEKPKKRYCTWLQKPPQTRPAVPSTPFQEESRSRRISAAKEKAACAELVALLDMYVHTTRPLSLQAFLWPGQSCCWCSCAAQPSAARWDSEYWLQKFDCLARLAEAWLQRPNLLAWALRYSRWGLSFGSAPRN